MEEDSSSAHSGLFHGNSQSPPSVRFSLVLKLYYSNRVLFISGAHQNRKSYQRASGRTAQQIRSVTNHFIRRVQIQILRESRRQVSRAAAK
jgi:hypothetical protein